MQALRGTQDILPDNIYKWNHVESVIKEYVLSMGIVKLELLCLRIQSYFFVGLVILRMW